MNFYLLQAGLCQKKYSSLCTNNNLMLKDMHKLHVTKIFIHITNKLMLHGNKKAIDSLYTTDRLVIQQDSRAFLSKV